MAEKIIVGLDIGTTKIACFIGKKNDEGKIEILGYGRTPSSGIERGQVISIIGAADSIKKAVKSASEMAGGYEVKEVYVGIAGQHIKSIRSNGSIMVPPEHPYVLQEDLDNLIGQQYQLMLNPGEEIVHVFPQKYIADDQELLYTHPVGVPCAKLECQFHIVTGDVKEIKKIYSAVIKAGLEVKQLVLEPIASSRAVLNSMDTEAGVALVDIGGGTTDIAIFQDKVIRHTAVLPLAGNVITRDIQEGCTVLRHQAETLKTRFGNCLPTDVSADDYISIPGYANSASREISMKTLAGIVKARTVMILDLVNHEIEMSEYKNKLIAGIMLTGGGSMLANIEKLCEYTTGLNTIVGKPDALLSNNTPQELKNPMYSTGIGLLAYGIEAEENTPEPEPEPEPIPESTPEPEYIEEEEEENTKSSKKEKKKKEPKEPKFKKAAVNVSDAVKGWLNKFIGEDIDTIDESED